MTFKFVLKVDKIEGLSCIRGKNKSLFSAKRPLIDILKTKIDKEEYITLKLKLILLEAFMGRYLLLYLFTEELKLFFDTFGALWW